MVATWNIPASLAKSAWSMHVGIVIFSRLERSSCNRIAALLEVKHNDEYINAVGDI